VGIPWIFSFWQADWCRVSHREKTGTTLLAHGHVLRPGLSRSGTPLGDALRAD